MNRLPFTVHHAGLHQIDDAVRAHLRVNAKIAFVVQTMKHSLGNSADAGLQRRSVRNERGHVARNAHVHFSERLCVQFKQRTIGLHDCREMADVNGCLAMRTRHLLVDLGDHGARQRELR